MSQHLDDRSEIQAFVTETLLDDVGAIVVRVDSTGSRIIYGRSTERITGYNRRELASSNWLDLLLPEARYPDLRAVMTKLQASESDRPHLQPILMKSGEERAILWTNHLGGEGDPFLALTVGIDDAEHQAVVRTLSERGGHALLAAEIATAQVSSGTSRQMLTRVTDSLVRHLGAAFARIWTLDSTRKVLELQASSGMYTHIDGGHARVPVGQFKIGMVAAERKPHLTNNVMIDPRVSNPEWARKEGMVAFAGHPLIVGDEVVGVMALFARKPLSDATLQALGSVADMVALGIHRKSLEVREKTLEEKLRQSQKMDALGRLAGGVAHDFNNLLTVIMGYTEMLHASLPSADPRQAEMKQIMQASERASSLTRQLLAFSRKRVVQATRVDLNEVLRNLSQMLQRLLEDNLKLNVVLGPALEKVLADIGGLEQVVVNLVVNARDAMGGAGTVRISTSNVDLVPRAGSGLEDLAPGRYVELSVQDEGCGMSPEVQARLFEPFFTTKERGKGTGLGLSTIHGIVRQCRGGIEVISEVGKGSTFRVYLPVAPRGAGSQAPAVASGRAGGAAHILLVEDEPAVLQFAKVALSGDGHHVQTATSIAEALEVARTSKDPVDLVITDCELGDLTGRELIHTIRRLRPSVKAILMSGSPRRGEEPDPPGTLEDEVLEKPFSGATLRAKVRSVLSRAHRQ
ncbi:MAG: ATP-binding protein [Planctomycetota bacterium]